MISLNEVNKTNGETFTEDDIATYDNNFKNIETEINSLSIVSKTGSYNDLSDKPSLGNIVTSSSTNGNIIINGTETTVYTHPTGATSTNPHNTTKADVGLGNVTNESKVTMFTNPTFTGSIKEGFGTTASGNYAHAMGNSTTASGDYSLSGGFLSTANAFASRTSGVGTTSNVFASNALGQYNKLLNGSLTSFSAMADALVIGNGTNVSNLSNAFRATFDGRIYGLSAFNSSGADLAEFAEWQDGNINKEERVGYFVTTNGKQIKKAINNDYIYGVISGSPCLVGNSDNGDWNSKYLRDDFNRIIYEDVEEEIIQIDEETHETTNVKTGNIIKNGRMKLNPNYDATKEYTSREERPEWDYVCKRGMIPVRDDGTCVINKWCKCNKDGVATLATERGFDTFMVLDRITENIVLIEFR